MKRLLTKGKLQIGGKYANLSIAELFPLLEDKSIGVRGAAWDAVRTIDPDFAGLGDRMGGITDWRGFQHVHNWTVVLDSTAYRIGKGSFGQALEAMVNCGETKIPVVVKMELPCGGKKHCDGHSGVLLSDRYCRIKFSLRIKPTRRREEVRGRPSVCARTLAFLEHWP